MKNMLKSRKILLLTQNEVDTTIMKIYDYNGKKNICGEKIHEIRRKRKLTQSELAAKLQLAGIIIERDSISRIEIGTRFVADYELREIARILKTSVTYLLGEK